MQAKKQIMSCLTKWEKLYPRAAILKYIVVLSHREMLMGDWEWGYNQGLWGADGIPYDVANFSRRSTRSFDIKQTTKNEYDTAANIEKKFKTFKEAAIWAKANPGKTITRAPDGNEFIAKKGRHSPNTS